MSTCACGKPSDTFGGFCGRCAALQTLELEPYASPAEIEDAYLTLVKAWHPDRFQTDLKMRRAAEEKIKEVNAAHDYLTSAAAVEEPGRVAEKPDAIPEPRPRVPEASTPVDEESPELRRVLKRYEKRSSRTFLPRLLFAAGGIALMVFLWISMDFVLSGNPNTQRYWEDLKTQTSRDIHSSILRLMGNATENLHESQGQNEQAPAAANEPAPVAEHKVEAGAKARTSPPIKVVSGVKPYITSGLTTMEVLSVLGNPTSSSGEKVFYNGSEIDFRDGHVAGWKIDPKNPIRVKLWPDRPMVAGVQAYSLGSTKSDVIALQGTPTLFSDNEFGYGGSVVYFKSGLVVSWKEDPASVKLRVVSQ
jgi:curved DNA-binding protein CbpA